MGTEHEKAMSGAGTPPFIEVDTFLFEVVFVHTLPGQCHALAKGIPRGGPVVRIGQALLLVTPDGQETRTYIKGLPLIRLSLDYKGVICDPIEVPISVNKAAIPVGTKVWAVKKNDNES
ncbi:hypothetical protein EON80_11615 [bacterium]|nr:MAG: hypothetical protein EON80_11615 [bacterium]